MKVRIKPSKAHGIVKAPTSKSMAHRYLVCAALAQGESTLHHLELSEDILATLDVIKHLGAAVDFDPQTADHDQKTVKICGIGGVIPQRELSVDCRECGTTIRFFLPLLWLSHREATVYGSKRLLERPLDIYEDIAQKTGGYLIREKDDTGSYIRTKGEIASGAYAIPGNISSQFVSGMLYALLLCPGASTLRVAAPIESASYIFMTVAVIERFGGSVTREKEGEDLVFRINGDKPLTGGTFTLEGDYSNAAFLDVFNTIGGCVFVSGLKKDSIQGDRVYKELFEKIVKEKPTIDLKDCPDLGPVLMAAAACNNGAEFIGTARLKIKERNL